MVSGHVTYACPYTVSAQSYQHNSSTNSTSLHSFLATTNYRTVCCATFQIILYNIQWHRVVAAPGGRAVWGSGLRSLACCDRDFKYCTGTWMFLSCEYCVLSGRGLCVWLMGLALVRGDPTECECVSLIVIRCNSNFLHLQWLCRRRSD